MLLLAITGPEPPALSAYSSSTAAASDGCAAAGDGCTAASAAAAYASDGSREAKAWIRLSRVSAYGGTCFRESCAVTRVTDRNEWDSEAAPASDGRQCPRDAGMLSGTRGQFEWTPCPHDLGLRLWVRHTRTSESSARLQVTVIASSANCRLAL